jgi:eukaryotic-like serine/threonine-protein kinase
VSDSPESPRPASRFGFQWGHYRYDVHGPLASHPDYSSPLLATRQLLLPGLSPDVGQSRLVELTALTEEYGPAALQRCIEQVRRAGFIRHPNAAGVWGAVFDEKTPYILMEHLRGCSLLALMEAALSLGRSLSPAFVAYVGVELAEVLEYAHRKKDEEEQPLHVVHRAVGPMRIRVGVTGRIQLTHFGVAYSELLDKLETLANCVLHFGPMEVCGPRMMYPSRCGSFSPGLSTRNPPSVPAPAKCTTRSPAISWT